MKYWRRPLDSERVRTPLGEVHIFAERCKGCGFCIEYCPRDVLKESASFNRKGYHPPEVIQPGACVNCNLCEMICPDFAIFSVLAAERAAGVGVARAINGEPAEGVDVPRAVAEEPV